MGKSKSRDLMQSADVNLGVRIACQSEKAEVRNYFADRQKDLLWAKSDEICKPPHAPKYREQI